MDQALFGYVPPWKMISFSDTVLVLNDSPSGGMGICTQVLGLVLCINNFFFSIIYKLLKINI